MQTLSRQHCMQGDQLCAETVKEYALSRVEFRHLTYILCLTKKQNTINKKNPDFGIKLQFKIIFFFFLCFSIFNTFMHLFFKKWRACKLSLNCMSEVHHEFFTFFLMHYDALLLISTCLFLRRMLKYITNCIFTLGGVLIFNLLR